MSDDTPFFEGKPTRYDLITWEFLHARQLALRKDKFDS